MEKAAADFRGVGLLSTARVCGEMALTERQREGSGVEAAALELAKLCMDSGRTRSALRLISTACGSGTKARLLTAQCFLAEREWESVLEVTHEELQEDEDGVVGAALCVVRGNAYEGLENAARAARWYCEALKKDFRCIEAFERLVIGGLIGVDEAIQVVEALDPESPEWTRRLYRCYSIAQDPSRGTWEAELAALQELVGKDTPYVRLAAAMRAWSKREYGKCVELTSDSLLGGDGYSLLLYLASAFETKKEDLFAASHRLEDQKPQSAVSCLAIGYYYLQNRSAEKAKRYLQKATVLDPRFAQAWVALGHVLSAQDDSDGALGAYRSASRLMPACNLPLLFSGMEYARLHFTSHAESYIRRASEIAQWDPSPLYELAVLRYNAQDFEEAFEIFQRALLLIEGTDSEGRRSGSTAKAAGYSAFEDDLVESVLLGLGHVKRRDRQYGEARSYYERALVINPSSLTTRASIGMTYHGDGEIGKAVELYHQALRDQPQNSTIQSLLSSALEEVTAMPP